MTSRFLTDLDMREADRDVDNGRWVLCEPLIYSSDVLDRIVTVPRGFVTDLASVPRLPLVYWLCGGRANKPSVVHDFLYGSGIVSREKADAVFLEAMEVVGVPAVYRRLMWAGVRAGGAGRYVNPASNF